MFKLWATIIKDARILLRDKVGLTLMFAMPILLVLIITSIQVSTFDLVNNNKVALMLCNQDKGEASIQLIQSLQKLGMFKITFVPGSSNEQQMKALMQDKDALLGLVIPSDFSVKINSKAKEITRKAINDTGSVPESGKSRVGPLTLYYHPVLQTAYRHSIVGALHSALQLVESKQMLQSLYFSLNEKKLPDELENEIVSNQIGIEEIPVSKDGSKTIPNATQHNIPAWTVFAMFFIVTSLGSNVVKEKQSGSFLRLKTLPTSYMVALLSKQITYMGVCMLQVFVIFSIGIWVFPHMGLPGLNLPEDVFGLVLVSIICGGCAISYAICIGVYAETQEQANGFGAVSVVILAALGGILVPSFAMPTSFHFIMKLSPLHWCLESYYGLFLEGAKFKDVLINILPLLGMTFLMQLITYRGLKIKNLI
jgi:ABC-2 type transport system permease protein